MFLRYRFKIKKNKKNIQLSWKNERKKNDENCQYLAESIRKHPDQETLKSMALDAGFGFCEYHNLTGGIVALHKAIKT